MNIWDVESVERLNLAMEALNELKVTLEIKNRDGSIIEISDFDQVRIK